MNVLADRCIVLKEDLSGAQVVAICAAFAEMRHHHAPLMVALSSRYHHHHHLFVVGRPQHCQRREVDRSRFLSASSASRPFV